MNIVSRSATNGNITVKVSLCKDTNSIVVIAYDAFNRMPFEHTIRYFHVSQDDVATAWVKWVSDNFVV